MRTIRWLLFIALLGAFITTSARAEKPLGVRIREELEHQNLALVDWSNIALDPLDKELEARGHKFARYADDFIVMVKSANAAKRVGE